MNKKIGLHIRLDKTITAVAEKALRLKLPIFQTFAITTAKEHFTLTQKDRQSFLQLRPKFQDIFLHASYWINCASETSQAEKLLAQEVAIAQALDIPFVIVHPGAITLHQEREHGIDLIAQKLNNILKQFPDITLLLENVGHAGRSLGGNIKELGSVLEKIAHPERLGFCIDTAHAYIFGYDLVDEHHRTQFFEEIEQHLSFEKVHAIHLNDTPKTCGSKIDIHAVPGKGIIGKKVLQGIMNHPKICTKPLILETPKLEDYEEAHIVETIDTW